MWNISSYHVTQETVLMAYNVYADLGISYGSELIVTDYALK